MAGKQGPPPTSPYIYESPDYLGRMIRMTVNFDNTTGALLSGSTYRDPDCAYTSVYWGLGNGNVPQNSIYAFTCPLGLTQVTAAVFTALSLVTINDLLSKQVTAA